MSQVYQGRNRGGLINFVVVDDLKQLEIWGPRFELTNFVNVIEYLDNGMPPGLSAMEVGKRRKERVMWMPKNLTENTTFYAVVDWEDIELRAGADRSVGVWDLACRELGLPGAMSFIPSKVLLFTENRTAALRDATSEQSRFIAEVLEAETEGATFNG
jgi:hypothetical protein